MSDIRKTIEMDQEEAATFAKAAGEITVAALNKFDDRQKQLIDATLQNGGRLYLHVQLHPTFEVFLALDPADPNKPPLELGRWTGAAPEEITRILN